MEENIVYTLDNQNELGVITDNLKEEGINHPKIKKIEDVLKNESSLAKLLKIRLTANTGLSLIDILKNSYYEQYGLLSFVKDNSKNINLIKSLKGKRLFCAPESKNIREVENEIKEAISKNKAIPYSCLQIKDFQPEDSLKWNTSPNESIVFMGYDTKTNNFVNIPFSSKGAFREMTTNSAFRDFIASPDVHYMCVLLDTARYNSIAFENKENLALMSKEICNNGRVLAMKIDDNSISANITNERALKNGFTINDINWNTLQEIGISKALLEKNDRLSTLLKGEKTDIMDVHLIENEIRMNAQAKLRLGLDDKGTPTIYVHGVRNSIDLRDQFMGYTFTDSDKANLEKFGTMFKEVTIQSKTGKDLNVYIGIDPQTKELVALPSKKIRILDTIKGVKITKEQKEDIKTGLPVKVDNLVDDKGQTYSAFLAIDPAGQGIKFYNTEPKIIAFAKKSKQQVKSDKRSAKTKELKNADAKKPAQTRRRGLKKSN